MDARIGGSVKGASIGSPSCPRGKKNESWNARLGRLLSIVVAVIGVSVIMSAVLDIWSHWIPVVAAIIVGLWAVQSINK